MNARYVQYIHKYSIKKHYKFLDIFCRQIRCQQSNVKLLNFSVSCEFDVLVCFACDFSIF
jgi:hypothetical protein